MAKRPPWLRHFPIILGMVVLLLPWGLVAFNGVAGAFGRVQWVVDEPRLVGVVPPLPPLALSAASFWSGGFQWRFTDYFDRTVPLRSWAVGLKNQLYYTVLGMSGVPGIVVGKHGQLFESDYISEYCGRHTAAILQEGEHWAGQLAQLQAWYAAEGKVFVYVMTPSKPATYPQYLPDARACRAPPTERDALGPEWDAMLDRHGVHYVDAVALVRRNKPNYPFEMFPMGGTHWNDVAAALAVQAVVRRVDAASARWMLPDFAFTWQLAAPDAVGRDLTDLLNLPFPRLDYRVPIVAVTSAPQTACHPPTMAAVGGSFTFELLFTLMKLPCPPHVDFYAYFRLFNAVFPGNIQSPVDPQQRADALLDRADIVLLEENEQVMIRSKHGPALYALVAARHAAPSP